MMGSSRVWILLFAPLAGCATIGDHPHRLAADRALARQEWAPACEYLEAWRRELPRELNAPQLEYLYRASEQCAGPILKSRLAEASEAAQAGRTAEAIAMMRAIEDWKGRVVLSPPASLEVWKTIQSQHRQLRRDWAKREVERLRAERAAGPEHGLEAARRLEQLWAAGLKYVGEYPVADVFWEHRSEILGAHFDMVRETPGRSLQASIAAQLPEVMGVANLYRREGTSDRSQWAGEEHRQLRDLVIQALEAKDLTARASGDVERLELLNKIRQNFDFTPLWDRLFKLGFEEAKPFAARAKAFEARGLLGLAYLEFENAERVGGSTNPLRDTLRRGDRFRWTAERAKDACASVPATVLPKSNGSGSTVRIVSEVNRCAMADQTKIQVKVLPSRSEAERDSSGNLIIRTSDETSSKWGQFRLETSFEARLTFLGPWGTETRTATSSLVFEEQAEADQKARIMEKLQSRALKAFQAAISREVERFADEAERKWGPRYASTIRTDATSETDLADSAVRTIVLGNSLTAAQRSALARWTKLPDDDSLVEALTRRAPDLKPGEPPKPTRLPWMAPAALPPGSGVND